MQHPFRAPKGRVPSFGVAALLVGTALTAGLVGLAAEPAHAFGTANILKQRGEHERVTRRALGCGILPPPCFEAKSLYNLAGSTGTFGAVGAPDDVIVHVGEGPDRWHCDNADYFDAGDYPRTRAQATAALQDCWNFVRDIQGPGVPGNEKRSPSWGAVPVAKDILNSKGQVDISNPGDNFLTSCSYGGRRGRVKCDTYESWGYRLHAVQDFYSHSNWVDVPDPGRPISVANPPGLGPQADVFFDTRRSFALPDPRLSTGCYPSRNCPGRIRHDEDINKDKGAIDVGTGRTSDPLTTRGKINVGGRTNFDRAVAGAVEETRKQWWLLRWALVERYGADGAAKRTCALWRDRAELCNKGFLAAAVATDDASLGTGQDLFAGLDLRGGISPSGRGESDAGDDVSLEVFDENGHAGQNASELADGELDGLDPGGGAGGAANALERALHKAENGLVADQRRDPPPPAQRAPEVVGVLPPDIPVSEEASPEEGAEPAPPVREPPPAPVPDPTREGAVVLADSENLGDVSHLVDVVRKAGRDGIHVSMGLVGEGWAPEALVRAVDRTGGTIVARRGGDSETAEALDGAGLTLQDDALGDDWGAPLTPGGAVVEGVTDSSEDQYPLVDSGTDQQLVLRARDRPVKIRLYDTEKGNTRTATAEPGRPADIPLRDGVGYEVRVASPSGRQFELAVRPGH